MLDCIMSAVSFLGDLCILIITVYTFYLSFISKRISVVSAGHRIGIDGENITLLLKHHGMRPISIQNIHCVFGSFRIQMGKWDEPLVLNSFSTLHVEMEPFSYLADFNIGAIWGEKFYVIIHTVDGDIYAKYGRHVKIYKNYELKDIVVKRIIYNGHIVFPYYKYALDFISEGQLKTVFIWENGAMTDDVPEYVEKSKTINMFNRIPPEIATNKKTIESYFNRIFEPLGIKYSIIELTSCGDIK